MKIILNNREEEFSKDVLSITEMLVIMKYSYKMRIVKVNGKFIPRENYDTTEIRDGDSVQMLYLMSGG